MKIKTDPLNLYLEKIYPKNEPKKVATMTPEKTRIKLFIKDLFNKTMDSIIFSIVGSTGGVIGVVNTTSFELFKAVTIQLHSGSRLVMTSNINNPNNIIRVGLIPFIAISPCRYVIKRVQQ
jgi:hypothetical protein